MTILAATAIGVLLVACAGNPAAPAPPAPPISARASSSPPPSSSPSSAPAPSFSTDTLSAAELPAEPPPADGTPGLGTGLGGGGTAWGCGIGIDGTCGFHLFLAQHNKVEASEECLTWRRRALQQQHAPAGVASIERVRLGRDMDEPAVRDALEPAVRGVLGCYEEALRIQPKLRGHLAVRLTLNAQGCVTHAVDAGSSLPAPHALHCAINRFLAVALPAPPSAPSAVTLILALSPDPSREQPPLTR